jgi:hypothetical protein
MDSETPVLTLESVAQAAAEEIQGLTLAEIFTTGPRRLFVEWAEPKHGTYRLYVSRPFGPRKRAGDRFRIQLTAQYEGQELEQPVNDGYIFVSLEQLGDVIIGAAEQLQEHINANRKTMQQLRRAAMQAVQAPGTLIVNPGDGDVTQGDDHVIG